MFSFIHKIVSKRGTIVNLHERCVYCGICEKTCHHNALSVDRKQKQWLIDHDKCMRCHHCVEKCPRQALQLLKNK